MTHAKRYIRYTDEKYVWSLSPLLTDHHKSIYNLALFSSEAIQVYFLDVTHTYTDCDHDMIHSHLDKITLTEMVLQLLLLHMYYSF